MNKIRVQLLKEKGRDGENRVTKKDREIEIEIDRYIYGEREIGRQRREEKERKKRIQREGESEKVSFFCPLSLDNLSMTPSI